MNDQQVHDFLVSAPAGSDVLRRAIDRLYHADEAEVVRSLLAEARLDPATQSRVDARARELVRAVRERKADQGLMEAFMQEYDLSSEEGVVLMCLAEALLRIPDDDTAEKLIADKLGDADWESHLGKSNSVLVNASTWGLMLTGKLVALAESTQSNFRTALKRLINRSGRRPNASSVRRDVPKRLVTGGNAAPRTFVNSNAGPPAAITRLWISATSWSASTGVSTTARSPSRLR